MITIRLFSKEKTTYVFLTALVPLLLVYIPKPPIPGSQFIIYPVLAVIFLVLIVSLSTQKKLFINAKIKFLLLLLFLYDIILVISFLINASELRSTAPLELFRPLLLTIFLLYGYYMGCLANQDSLEKGLLIAAYAIILGQLVIAIAQALGFNYFNFLYSASKSREFGTIFRVTGSLGNPNNMAWVISNSAVMVSFLADRKQKNYWIIIIIAFILVVMSSSRTMLLLSPLMIISSIFLSKKNNKQKLIYLGSISIFISIFIFYVFGLYSKYFPYILQLKTVFESGSFMSINSFAHRTIHWGNVYQEFYSAGFLNHILGLGSRQIVKTVDNDFLYVLYRVGWFGLSIHLLIIFYCLLILNKSKIKKIAAIGRHYLFFALVFGMVAETLASWYQPLLLFFILGLNIGFSEKTMRQASFNDKFNISLISSR